MGNPQAVPKFKYDRNQNVARNVVRKVAQCMCAFNVFNVAYSIYLTFSF